MRGGPKMDEGVKISKSKILQFMLEMVNLHIKISSKNFKIFTAFISSAVEVFPYTYFGRGVV